MGRKTKPENELKRNSIKIRLTDEEYNWVCKNAYELDMGITSFVRKLIDSEMSGS